jgi:4-carboxymuconolactone decarboxylase
MRIEPLPAKAYSEEMRAALSALQPAGSTHQLATTNERPKPLNLLGVMAHHPVLARAYFTFNGHLLGTTTLSARHRELLVMRVAAVRHCESEWIQHLLIARDAGLSDEEVDRIADGSDAPLWDELEAGLLSAVDELLVDGKISEQTWQVLSEQLSTQQLLDVIFTVGGYDTLAKVFESLQLEIEPDTIELMKGRWCSGLAQSSDDGLAARTVGPLEQ